VPSRWDEWMLLRLYRAAFSLVIALFVIIFPLWLFSPKRRATLFKRLGWQAYPHQLTASGQKPALKPLWIHALSIGELLSAEGLIQRLHGRLGGRPLFLSVSTASAFALARGRFAGLCDGIFYFPYDIGVAVTRCLDAVDPAVIVMVETDIWPAFLAEVRRRRIPALLINGRLSPESLRTYSRLRLLFEPSFNTFRSIYPQSASETERFLAIGVNPERLRRPGNLKFDVAAALPASHAVAAIRQELFIPADARILIAGSTHQGEEELIRSCFLRLRSRFPDLQLIVVPRRPERGSEVRSLFQADALHTALASELDRPATVVVIDRIGYLSRLYALAEVAVIGGSFVPQGGQNPIEPAAWAKPVLFGPDMHDFPDVAAWLLNAGGAIQAANEADLYEACDRLLSDPEAARAMGQQARAVVTQHQGATDRVAQEVVVLLSER
jgi:3-deoxy-D-manno-octulosonic-acid transferase